MDRVKKSTRDVIVLVIIIVFAVCALCLMLNLRKKANKEPSSMVATPSNIQAETAPAESDLKLPSYYGVEREIYNVDEVDMSDLPEVEQNVGDISFNDIDIPESRKEGSLSSSQIDGNWTDDEKEKIARKIKVHENGYAPNINWSKNKSLSNEQYNVLLICIGETLERKLNESGNYNVIVNYPDSNIMQKAGIPYYYEFDDYGYLSMWCDVTTQNLDTNKEIQELKYYTIYYDGEVIGIKED